MEPRFGQAADIRVEAQGGVQPVPGRRHLYLVNLESLRLSGARSRPRLRTHSQKQIWVVWVAARAMDCRHGISHILSWDQQQQLCIWPGHLALSRLARQRAHHMTTQGQVVTTGMHPCLSPVRTSFNSCTACFARQNTLAESPGWWLWAWWWRPASTSTAPDSVAASSTALSVWTFQLQCQHRKPCCTSSMERAVEPGRLTGRAGWPRQ
jgi:hypothetical protein